MSPKRSEMPASSTREASSRHVLTRAMQFPLPGTAKGRNKGYIVSDDLLVYVTATRPGSELKRGNAEAESTALYTHGPAGKVQGLVCTVVPTF